VGVNQEGKHDTGLLAKEAGIIQVAQADGRQCGSRFLELVFVLAQLRDVLAAEDSTVVAQEHDDAWACLPQGAEANLIATGFGQYHIGELRAERIGHGLVWADSSESEHPCADFVFRFVFSAQTLAQWGDFAHSAASLHY